MFELEDLKEKGFKVKTKWCKKFQNKEKDFTTKLILAFDIYAFWIRTRLFS